jgi:hypothetical protein
VCGGGWLGIDGWIGVSVSVVMIMRASVRALAIKLDAWIVICTLDRK